MWGRGAKRHTSKAVLLHIPFLWPPPLRRRPTHKSRDSFFLPLVFEMSRIHQFVVRVSAESRTTGHARARQKLHPSQSGGGGRMSEREMHFSAEFGLERREEEGDAFSLQAPSPLLSSSSSSAGLSRQRVLCSSGEEENIEDADLPKFRSL